MGRGPAKAKAKAKLPVAGKSRKNEGSRERQLEKRLAEALDQQTATSEILRVISRSQTDVQPVFDTIAESALGLLGAWSVLVLLFDGELLHLGAARGGLPDSERYQRERFPMRLRPENLLARCILERSPQQDPDALADPDPTRRDIARRRGFAAFLTVPMLRGGEAVGEVVVTRAVAGPFVDSDIALLHTFADQAVIAIENVRLFTELQEKNRAITEALERQTATAELLRVISRSQTELQPVFDAIADSAMRLLGAWSVIVCRFDGELLHLAALRGGAGQPDASVLSHFPTRPTVGLTVGRCILACSVIQISDVETEAEPVVATREMARASGWRSALAVPMLRDGQPIGAIMATHTKPRAFGASSVEVLQTFADQAVIAIENVRLFKELEQKSRELETASQHKSEFLANMSHELRTPLNAVIGFSDALLDRMFGDMNEKQEEYLRDIRDSGGHLLSLINDILDLSKVEAGRMELELNDFDLPAAIENALILVRERATRRGIALNQLIGERIGHIRADERKVKQVLLNLLSNAIKFTPEGGRIDVTAALVDGAVEISVTDTGIGIAPEDQQAVFEEFRQVGGADQKAEGTGLGLTLCRKFVELHGGRIGVRSEVGRGSTFTFTLPVGP